MEMKMFIFFILQKSETLDVTHSANKSDSFLF
jgi:hypothetical protein